MTTLIAYHPKTIDIALFETDGQFWIGEYSKFCTHQNGEPPYVFMNGYWDVEDDALFVLRTMLLK